MARLSEKELAQRIMPFLNRNPSASMEQIADATGMGRATLFRRFGSRAGLVRTLIVASLNDSCDAMRPLLEHHLTAEEGLQAVVDILLPFALDYGFLDYEPWLLVDPEAEKANDAYRDLWVRIAESWQDESGLIAGMPVLWATRVVDVVIWTAGQSVRNGEIAANDASGLVMKAMRRTLNLPCTQKVLCTKDAQHSDPILSH